MVKLRDHQLQLLKNLETTGHKVADAGGDDENYEVIGLPNCKGVHLYHKECLLQMMKSNKEDYIKCAVCETNYGIRVGSMPDGTFRWSLT